MRFNTTNQNPNPECQLRCAPDIVAAEITRRTELRLRQSASSRRRLQAFTLIELLLVLVILGILAAIVIPKFTGRAEQARNTAAQTQISSFSTALNAFEVDNGSFPKGKSGLNDLVQQPRETPNWHGPYLDSIPKDPWGHDYIYESPGKHNLNGFDIMSMGPDGRAGGDDDITNWQKK